MFEYRHDAGTTAGLAWLPGGVPESPSLGAAHRDRQLGTVRLPGCTRGPRRSHQGRMQRARLFGDMA